MIANLTRKFEQDYYWRVYSNRVKSRADDLKTFRSIIEDYPRWQASLFDEHFFNVKVAPMVEAARENGTNVSPLKITSAWADQLHLDAVSRHVRMNELQPVVEQLIANL